MSAPTATNGLHFVGISFRQASLAAREPLKFNEARCAEVLLALKNSLVGGEAMILATCNRTEFYLVAPASTSATKIKSIINGAIGISSRAAQWRYLRGDHAAQHYLRVSCGLESAILGDAQILGQVNMAARLAEKANTMGDVLRQLRIMSGRAAGRARTQTSISWGNASLGSAIASMFDFKGRGGDILILGAGEIARDAARRLTKRGSANLVFANRTFERARSLAREFNGEVIAWNEIPTSLKVVNGVIAATSAPNPILSRALLNEIAKERSSSLVIIDAGVPRNIEAGANMPVIDIDSIRERQGLSLEKRRAAIPQVEAIVRETLEGWQPPKSATAAKLNRSMSLSASEPFRAFVHRSMRRFWSHMDREWERAAPLMPYPLL